MLEFAEMAPKDHVLESALMAPKDQVMESALMAPKDHGQTQSSQHVGCDTQGRNEESALQR